MENSKIITRLRILSKQEMKDFILFADSPYFNSNAALIRLLKYLQKYHPDLKGTKLAKELVYRKVFPEKAVFKEKRLNDLMSQLFKLSEDFLAFDHFKKSPVARAKQEFLSYREKGMNKDFSKAAIKFKRVIEATPASEEYHFNLFLVNKELFIEQAENKVESLNAVFHHLDQYFIQEKLLFAVFAKNRERLLKEQFDFIAWDKLTDDKLKLSDLATFFSNVQEIIANENIYEIKNLINAFKAQKKILSQRLAYCIFIIILNIMLRKFQEIEDEATPIIFDLYKFSVAENFLSFNDEIHSNTFYNACIFAGKMNESQWLEDFILNYQDKIYPKKDKENTINIVSASILFERTINSIDLKEIARVIVEMNTLSFTDLHYTYMVKVQLARLHYSEFIIADNYEYFEYLINFCKNFESQLYRDSKTNKSRVTMFLNFSKTVKKLATYKYEERMEKITDLKKEITSSKLLFAKQWLIKKIGEAIRK